jgi:acetolactate synthase-1/2/3 large subunit
VTQRPTLFAGSAAHSERLTAHGGKVVAKALRDHDVEVVFTLCGGHVLPILDGCLDEGIRVIDARHEGAAVMMAAGYAYATRRPGVAAITAGPGFTNAVTGMGDANHSGVPVVTLAGRTPLRTWKRDAIQDIDQLAIAKQVSKRATLCLSAERLAEYVTDAFWHATAPRAGVAYVELPTDVLLSDAPDELGWSPGFPTSVDPPQASEASIARLVEVLESAERPVLICGSGPFWGRADDAVARFASTTGIPVTTTGPARGLLPDSHPDCLGGLAHGGMAVVTADVVVVCGSRFDGNMLFGGPPIFQPHQTLVQIDVRADAFGGNRVPDLAVHGDAGQVLDQVARAWKTGRRSGWLESARQMAEVSRAAWASESAAESDASVDGVHPGLVAREVDSVAHERALDERTLVCDGGDILTWGIAHFTAERPGSILTTGTALGTLGVGVPFAIGAKAARPGDLVVCLVGDGAFGLSAMELDTAARLDLPIVVVVSNNGAWADVQHEQQAWFGEDRLVGSNLQFTPYEKLADMVGGFGIAVDRPDEVRPALEKAIDSGRVAVVNVRTDPKVVSEILRGIGQLGVM